MKNRWDQTFAESLNGDLLKLRVYTSRLLGQDEDLVMHGGGNTSVKGMEKNIFGEEEEILFVKGSGWDLATIEEAGFAPVKLEVLKRLATLETLSDIEMVRNQRMAMTNPAAPNPSVEAILHAIIPFRFVDHTHADAVVTITNTPNGEQQIRELYGNRVLIIPYVMPGFILARTIFEMTQDFDWSSIDGMILMNHGVFTFDHDARKSYEKMIELVSTAESYLDKHATEDLPKSTVQPVDARQISEIRKEVAQLWGRPVLCRLNTSQEAVSFSALPNMVSLVSRGPLTPDHIIRTKRTPVVLDEDFRTDLSDFGNQYDQYFADYAQPDQTKLDRSPRWGLLPSSGTLSFGQNVKSIQIINDISRHTMQAIYRAEQLGGWTALPSKDLFEVEYWSLEQEKLKKGKKSQPFEGRVAIVTGALSGIGAACVETLLEEGAVVSALDINPGIIERFSHQSVLGIECDVTKEEDLSNALDQTVRHFGGVDLLVSNAGIFPSSKTIDSMDDEIWQRSIDVNLTSHRRLLQQTVPFLRLGFDPSVVIVGSKNVPAPGPGASAYSVAKAGLTQMVRVAALELGKYGIRINIVHPNAVYDTDIWTDEVLKKRAEHYGLTIDEYKTNNVLKTEVKSKDVAHLIIAMLGNTFSKTTGAQIPIDGGNERVI